MESKKRLYIIGAIAVLVIAGFVFWGAKQPSKVIAPTSEIIYYYGADCPHCKIVTQFFEENGIAQKVDFIKKEVWSSRDNASELQARAKECKLDSTNIGVPFLYAQGKCYIGDRDIVDFFKKEADIQ